jgi:hypothetical protein
LSDNCNCIVGDDEGVTIRRISGQFLDTAKRAKEEFIASNQSKKLVNVTMPYTIEFSLNLTYDPFLSLSLSIMHVRLVKEKILQKCLHWRQKTT